MVAIDLDTVTVQDEALAAVSRTVAEVYQILPLRFENGKRDLVIATAEPDNFDMLTDLGFMLSCLVKPVRADGESILAAIERHYIPPQFAAMHEVLRDIEALDSRGVIATAREGLRRALANFRDRILRLVGRHTSSASPHHELFTYQVILAVGESGAREATVESSKAGGRFHYVAADGEVVEYDLPPKWARRIMRRIVRMAKGSPRHAIPKGRIRLSIRGKPFSFNATRESITDGERVVLRLADTPTPEE